MSLWKLLNHRLPVIKSERQMYRLSYRFLILSVNALAITFDAPKMHSDYVQILFTSNNYLFLKKVDNFKKIIQTYQKENASQNCFVRVFDVFLINNADNEYVCTDAFLACFLSSNRQLTD